MSTEALVLDFDGVISDSAREAFVVALRTYIALHPDSPLRSVLDGIDPEAPEQAPLYASFLELMPLGNRAEDYGVVLIALERGATIRDQGDYDAFYREIDPGQLRTFHKAFYKTRTAWSEGDPAGWRSTLAPYHSLLPILRRRVGETQLAIATAKDRRSVQLLLEDYEIADLFPEGRVLDKETGVHKDAHLEHLHRVLGIDYPQMVFIDDKVSHLDQVARLGVRCALAAWGYNGPREHALARDRGHIVLEIDGLEEALF